MLSARSGVGVAEIVLYAPILAIAGFLAFIRHGRPRMAWFFILIFSCFRIASGIVSLLRRAGQDSVGLLVAAIITLNVGVIPLLLSTIGLIRVIVALEYSASQMLRKAVILIRVGFFIGIALLVSGGVLIGMYETPELPAVGSKLLRAGYIVLAFILLLMGVFATFFWIGRDLDRSARTCLWAVSVALPFQVVRIIYALVGVFNSANSRWNTLEGSLGLYIGMVLVMEFAVVLTYIIAGLRIEPVGRTVPHQSVSRGLLFRTSK